MMKNPKHPGLVLNELYVKPLELNANRLAIEIDVPRSRTSRILKGQTDISVDTAIRLAKLFDTTEQYWLNMQTIYDLATKRGATNVANIRTLRPAEVEEEFGVLA